MADDAPVQQFDAERAAAYDSRIRRLAPGYDALQNAVASVLASRLPNTAHLLVAGAGTGEEIVRLGQAHPDWHFTAVDPSPDMLDRCRTRVADAGLDGRVEHVCERVESMPEEQHFDAATSLLVAHFIHGEEAKQRYFRVLAQRLRPGAPLAWADLYRPSAKQDFRRLWTAWREEMSTRMAADEVSRAFERIKDGISFVRPGTLARIVRAAGFAAPTQIYQHLLWGAWVAEAA